MSEIRHVLGISGGKDSAALAIYMRNTYPSLDIEYYSCDTGRELDETYQLIERLESYLGKSILKLHAVDADKTSETSPFDHFLAKYGGYLPSSTARWCTKALKLEPFEAYIGTEPTISYVGIRGDEDREGYISKKENVQSIFPFRKNIWSEDVVKKALANQEIPQLAAYARSLGASTDFISVIETPIAEAFTRKQKLNALLESNTKLFNRVIFAFLKTTDYPVGKLDTFPLLDNEDSLGIDDIFTLLDESGVGIPSYYTPVEYEVEIDGQIKKGTYNRSRSGCFFCFFQQKIEWVWLFENHRELFDQAMEYEKDGYSWMDTETLAELSEASRREKIKRDHYLKHQKLKHTTSNWQDDILAAEGVGCASCFI
jgi:3'-phosphoadenosine 5'-phosphosulfate sulfotransferase (PAPS reductase)/FAD synthetase